MNDNRFASQLQDRRAHLCAKLRAKLAGNGFDASLWSDDDLEGLALRLVSLMWERGWDPMDSTSWDKAGRLLAAMATARGGAS